MTFIVIVIFIIQIYKKLLSYRWQTAWRALVQYVMAWHTL